jgi:DNA-directed RNA polymerase subunit RPC12/RpoP
MKCSFCEEPLVCASCKQPVRPRHGETHVAIYQPDMQVACPECQKVLVCRACGFVYGEQQEEEPTPGAS